MTYQVVPAFWQNLVPVVALLVPLVLQKEDLGEITKVGMNKCLLSSQKVIVFCGNVFEK